MEKGKPMIQQTPLSWAHDASFAILQRADHRRSFFLLLLVCQAFLPLQVSQALLIDRELNSAGGGSRAQVVHARLEALLPGVEMHAAHLAEVRLGDEDVERLRLVDERTAGSGHVDESLLGDFPDRLVEILQLGRNLINLLSRENIVAKSSQWKPTLSIFFLFLIIFWLFWSSLLVRKEDFWKWIPRETKPLAIAFGHYFNLNSFYPRCRRTHVLRCHAGHFTFKLQLWHFSAVDYQLIILSRQAEFSGCPGTRKCLGTRGTGYKSGGWACVLPLLFLCYQQVFLRGEGEWKECWRCLREAKVQWHEHLFLLCGFVADREAVYRSTIDIT